MRYAIYPTDKVKLVIHIVKRDVKRYLRWKHSWKTSSAGFAVLFVAILLGWNVLHSAALTGTIVPNSDVTVTGWAVGASSDTTCAGGTLCDTIDEGTGNGTGDYIKTSTTSGGETAEVALDNSITNIASATKLVISIYANNATVGGGTADTISVNLRMNGTLQTAGTCNPGSGTYSICNITFNGSWNQAALDSAQVQLVRNRLGSGSPSSQADDTRVSDVYATVTYTSNIQINQSAYRWFNNQDESGGGTFSTANQQEYAVGSNPKSVATADFNGDGNADIVTANYGGNTISVRLGNGDGTFGSESHPSVGSLPNSVATADFNGDGKMDIVTANSGGSNVSVLLGNGDGTFATQTTKAVGSGPYAVATADFNGDGNADIVIANHTDGTVSILLGNGDGTFATQTTKTVGTNPGAVATADFNGDGKMDIVTANSGGSNVSVLLGNGDGTFATQITPAVDTGPLSVSVADFNNDGKQDIATANSTDTYSILLGNGDGTFASQLSTSLGVGMTHATSADFNGDGKQDLAITFAGVSDRIGVVLGNGDGTFGTATYNSPDLTPTGVIAANVNGDNRPDIILVNSGASSASVFVNTTTAPISVGSPLANQDTAATAPAEGTIFRLRLDLHVTGAQLDAGIGGFKLQFAEKGGGTCSAPTGSYADVTGASMGIRYGDNPNAASGDPLTTNFTPPNNDPLYNGETSDVPQTYQEKGTTTFTNPTAISVGQDGMWDFGLVNYHAIQNTTYCFKVVKSDNSALTTYNVYPEITTPSASISQAAFRWYNPDPNGSATTFIKSYGSSSTESMADIAPITGGGYIATGNTGADVFLTKYTSSGAIIWTQKIDHGHTDTAKQVIQTSDGSFVVTGTYGGYNDSVTHPDYAFLDTFDSSGNLTREKMWGYNGASCSIGCSKDTAGQAVAQTADGGLIVAGATGAFGSAHDELFVVKYDSSGNVTWSNTWGSTTGYELAKSIVQTSADGGYTILGGSTTCATGVCMILLHYNSSGTLQWSKPYGSTNTGSVDPSALIQTADGGYAVVGDYSYTDCSVQCFVNTNGFMATFDSSGNMIAGGTHTVELNFGNEDGLDVIQTSDNGFLVAYSIGTQRVLVKYDSSGTSTWQKGFAGLTGLASLAASSTGFTMATGTNTYTSGGGGSDLVLTSVDSAGDVTNCPNTICTAANFTSDSNWIGSTTITAVQNSVTGGSDQSGNTTTVSPLSFTTVTVVAGPVSAGFPAAAQNKPLDLTSLNPISLRVALAVDNSGIDVSSHNFKLQFAPLIGATSCSATTGTYNDVTTSSALHYYDDPSYSNDQLIATDETDPTDGNREMQAQTYQELNNFSNDQSALYAGQDGIWQFSLAIDSATLKGRAFCLRVYDVTNSGQLTADNIGEVANSTQSFQRLRQGAWWNQEGKRQYFNL